MIYYIYNGELYHHGIKGQKWGVRRFQNKDGSLTAAGRKHVGVGDVNNRKKGESSASSGKVRSGDGSPDNRKQFKLSDRQKTAIKIGAVAVGTALAVYGGKKLYDHMEATSLGKQLTKKVLSGNNGDFEKAATDLIKFKNKADWDKNTGLITNKEYSKANRVYESARKTFSETYQKSLMGDSKTHNDMQALKNMARDSRRKQIKGLADTARTQGNRAKKEAMDLYNRKRWGKGNYRSGGWRKYGK